MRFDCRDHADSSWVADAERALRRDGFIVLDHVLPLRLVDSLRASFDARHQAFSCDQQEPRERSVSEAQNVGNRRYMVSLELTDPFADPLVYANPSVIGLLQRILGDDMKIDNFGAVLALAGAEQQHIHRDAPMLFQDRVDGLLPAHAVTVAFPLVEMNALHGTTALWPGTHRKPEPHPEQVEPEKPVVPLGSCVAWDYRLQHGGTANRSSRQRPILYLTYSRIWYQDPVNFRNQQHERLRIPAGFLETVSTDHLPLFAHL